MKKHFFLFLMLLSFFPILGNDAQAQSQLQQIKGRVTDAGNEPIVGASIMMKGSNDGTISDMEGRFSLNAPLGTTLVVSYIGYVTQKVKTDGRNKPLTIVLKEDTKRLGEVVVTALGIKRDRKALGYSLGEIKGQDLQKAKEPNVINSLAGKVAGLTVSQTATGPSGSTRVILRGTTSLSTLSTACRWTIPTSTAPISGAVSTLATEYRASIPTTLKTYPCSKGLPRRRYMVAGRRMA